LRLYDKSLNPASRQAGTKDHEVQHKVSQRKEYPNITFNTARFPGIINIMKKQFLIILFSLMTGSITLHAREIHVSVNGSDTNDGTASKPYKTISQATRVAMPADVITVHAGVYREQVTPPRGGNSDQERIVYQAAKGEKVEIKGSEIIKGWQKLSNDTWVVIIPNSFFGKFNPYSDLIHGDWFYPTPKDRIYHTGAVYLEWQLVDGSTKKRRGYGKG